MARPPEFDKHAELITDYIRKMGLYGVTQEIRFALTAIFVNDINDDELFHKVMKALESFQDELGKIQEDRMSNRKKDQPIYPIGTVIGTLA